MRYDESVRYPGEAGSKPRRRVADFSLGSLHGLGFAGAQWQPGAPPIAAIPARVGFSTDVEPGQLAAIGVALQLVGGLTRETS